MSGRYAGAGEQTAVESARRRMTDRQSRQQGRQTDRQTGSLVSEGTGRSWPAWDRIAGGREWLPPDLLLAHPLASSRRQVGALPQTPSTSSLPLRDPCRLVLHNRLPVRCPTVLLAQKKSFLVVGQIHIVDQVSRSRFDPLQEARRRQVFTRKTDTLTDHPRSSHSLQNLQLVLRSSIMLAGALLASFVSLAYAINPL